MTIPKYFSVNHEVVQLLPEYANCINYDSNNHFDKCMYSKLYDLMMAEHGCTGNFSISRKIIQEVDFFPKKHLKIQDSTGSKITPNDFYFNISLVPWLLNHSNICTNENKRQSTYDLYESNRRNQENICQNSCLFTNMYFGPPVTGINDEDKKNLAWAVFYFRRDIKTTKANKIRISC